MTKHVLDEELTMEALNDFLKEVVKNSYRCSHCELNHWGICFFAYDCLRKDFKYFTEAD